MSQMVTRQGPVGEDIDKRQTASPVKEMKKKMAANAEKEKIAAEKHVDKPKDKHDEKTDKKDKKETDKHADKAEKKEKSHDKKDRSLDKSLDKKDKNADKSIDKKDKSEKKDKATEKKDKSVEKKEKSVNTQVEKSTEKKETAIVTTVGPTEESTSAEKTVKQPTKDEDKQSDTVKQNGEASRQNGKASNGTASESDDGEEELVIVEPDNDEMFPELAYDDTSDTEPTDVDIRSATRRSQVKVTRTPETPRPASVKQADKETDDSKEMKLLKLKEDIMIPERRLRSSNSPKPSEKRTLDKNSPKEMKKSELETKTEEVRAEEKQENAQKAEGTVTEMVVEVENIEGEYYYKTNHFVCLWSNFIIFIVGINTDLPQSAPVAADDAFDPETIKPTPTPTPSSAHAHVATHVTPTTTATPTLAERDSKRCILM
ncbi:PREDICTED: TRAF3-interacting protein 1-like [Papilio polytes]|uniref:TRAF3-interacting protein 1-like n=1 Tax=Papilio polytes TaxID=76194 RepID=UPI000675F782|nr:PREDICTED: TRAF3-interacting protein 1-like [Papilio polytes]